MGSRPFGIEVYQFICPKTKETNKCAFKNTHSSKERKWFGAACFSMVFAHNFGELIARSWSTEAQGNIPAFLFLWHRKERGDGTYSSKKTGILGRPIPVLPYRSSLSCSMTNPWISKRRSTIFLISTPPPVVQDLGHKSKRPLSSFSFIPPSKNASRRKNSY